VKAFGQQVSTSLYHHLAMSEIQINVKGPSELKLQITINTDKTVLELKQAIAEKADVPADRQRLIYSGRVLKDEEVLSTYKIQTTHTIHMVKGVSRSAPSNAASVPQALPTMQAGQNPLDPLTQLNSHMGFGAMAGVNPFAEMGLNPNDPNMMQTMMNSPQFLQQMSSVISNPAVLDQIIASNPQLAAMAPQVREVFQSEHFRQIISNPERLQQMLQMASMFNGAGGSPFANPFGAPAAGGFPAPGNPSTGSANTTTPATTAQAGAPQANPFMGLFGAPPVGAGGPGTGAGAGAANPFGAMDPAMLQQLLGMGGAGGAGGFGVSPQAPADTRSPEERFEVQLQQLQDMGFTNASQNVRALLATAGNVHSAIEYILGGGGL
jgi:ubiquilin